MSRLSIAELMSQTSETPLQARFFAQFASKTIKETKTGKPYVEAVFADATGSLKLKAWADHKQFAELSELKVGTGLELEGQFTQNKWGLDGSPWAFALLNEDANQLLLAGDPVTLERQNADYADIEGLVGTIRDPRLKALCLYFLESLGSRFRRTAAARRNHHARRGGLVEHVAQMMRAANAIVGVYPDLNRDLMIAGVLFHDCGKLWENSYPESGFTQVHQLHGELLGHIPLGMELLNKLWRDLADAPENEGWKELRPSSDSVRLHLLHLVASHHGTHEFGSPTLPRTPEAFALHYIDNLDAKYEMLKDAYSAANELAPEIFERQFPLPANLVKPLAVFKES